MTREEFLVYMGHLNNLEHEEMNDYITDDITLEFYDTPTMEKQPHRVLRGRKDYIDHFIENHVNCKEILELGVFLSDDKNLLAEIYVEFHAVQETTLNTVKMSRGQSYCATHFLLYDIAPDGRFSRVRIAHHKAHDTPPKHHPVI